jgi:predicted amidophosphoribosyltransferase
MPDPCPEGLPETWAGGVYEGTLAAVVAAWKDDDRPHLGVLLAPLLAGAMRCAVSGSPAWRASLRLRPALAVPVPSRSAGKRARGRFPVHDLVRAVLPRGQHAVRVVPALTVCGGVLDQAGLGREERARNLVGAMGVKPRHRRLLDGAPVLLVDDVVTTGATLVEAARVLRVHGAGPVLAVTVAATPRRWPRQEARFGEHSPGAAPPVG